MLTQNRREPLIRYLRNFPIIGGMTTNRVSYRMRLYRTLRPTVGMENLIETTNQLLKLERV